MIDTEQKRYAALNFGGPPLTVVLPPVGDIERNDRFHLLRLYGETTVPVADETDVIWRYKYERHYEAVEISEANALAGFSYAINPVPIESDDEQRLYATLNFGGPPTMVVLPPVGDIDRSDRFHLLQLYGTSAIEVSFTDESVAAATYMWDFGDGQSSSEKNPTHVYPMPDVSQEYTVTLVINGGGSPELSAIQSVEIFNVG